MSGQQVRQNLIKAVQEEFNKAYPFLRIDFVKVDGGLSPLSIERGAALPEEIQEAAKDILRKDLHLTDDMKVLDLELSLRTLFGTTVQVQRKSGKLWMETKMTRNWTLKQQNDHAREIAG